jgi:hypothetical protein
MPDKMTYGGIITATSIVLGGSIIAARIIGIRIPFATSLRIIIASLVVIGVLIILAGNRQPDTDVK